MDWLVWGHRWLGIATCLLLAMWFASGAILLFVPFPSLPATEQWRLAKTVSTGLVAVPPRVGLAGSARCARASPGRA